MTVEEQIIDVTVVEDEITLNVYGGASPVSVATVASDLSDHEALTTTAHGGLVSPDIANTWTAVQEFQAFLIMTGARPTNDPFVRGMFYSDGENLKISLGPPVVYTANDDFGVDVALGDVPDSAAYPGPGTRYSPDAAGVVQVSGGAWENTNSGQASVFGFDAMPRLPGQITFARFGRNAADPGIEPGVWAPYLMYLANPANENLPQSHENDGGISLRDSDIYIVFQSNLSAILVSQNTVSTGELYDFVIVSREEGFFVFQDGVMLFPSLSGTNPTLQPVVFSPATYDSPVIDTFRIPEYETEAWLPSPTVSDSFDDGTTVTNGKGHPEGAAGSLIGQGGAGILWHGDTFESFGGSCKNSLLSSAGVEYLQNGDFSEPWAGGVPGPGDVWWVENGSMTYDSGTAILENSGTMRIYPMDDVAGSSDWPSGVLTFGINVNMVAGSSIRLEINGTRSESISTAGQHYISVASGPQDGTDYAEIVYSGASGSILSDVSIKAGSPTANLRMAYAGSPHVICEGNFNAPDLKKCGVVASIDNLHEAGNFVMGSMEKNSSGILSVKLEKSVNGELTTVDSNDFTITYHDDARLILKVVPYLTYVQAFVYYGRKNEEVLAASGFIADTSVNGGEYTAIYIDNEDAECVYFNLYPSTGHDSYLDRYTG